MKTIYYKSIFGCLLWAIIMSWSERIFAQSAANYTPSVIPPSPNAASLGKYGDVPVGYYTGVPNTTIPIYTIEAGDLKVPVSISYHHSGIKVTEEASNIGLGWTLNAGGVITRNVKRMDDLDEQYGVAFNPIGSETDILKLDNNTAFFTKYNGGNVGNMDSEPDIFNYNINGSSGKFILEQKVNNTFPIKAIMLDQTDVIITVDKLPSSNPAYPNYVWTIKMTNGTIYTFSEYEKTKGGSATISTDLGNNNGDGIVNTGYPQQIEGNSAYPILDYGASKGSMSASITAWYLTSIKSANTNNEITFIYDQSNLYYSTSRITCTERMVKGGPLKPNLPIYACVTSIYGNNASGYTFSANVSSNVYLQKITFPNGELSFGLADREDIQEFKETDGFPSFPAGVTGYLGNRSSSTLPTKKPQKIQNIVLKSNSIIIKQWEFNQSYFNSSLVSPLTTTSTYQQKNQYYNNLRLRLDGIKEKNAANTQSSLVHKFIYNGDVLDNNGNMVTTAILPKKTSFASDYWGYYNNTPLRRI